MQEANKGGLWLLSHPLQELQQVQGCSRLGQPAGESLQGESVVWASQECSLLATYSQVGRPLSHSQQQVGRVTDRAASP